MGQLGPLSFNLDSSWPCLEGNFSPKFNTGPTWEPAENASFCWYFLFSGMEEVRARPCPPCQVHVGPSLGPTWWTAFAAERRNTTACYHHFFFNICSARQTNVCAKVWETSSCTVLVPMPAARRKRRRAIGECYARFRALG